MQENKYQQLSNLVRFNSVKTIVETLRETTNEKFLVTSLVCVPDHPELQIENVQVHGGLNDFVQDSGSLTLNLSVESCPELHFCEETKTIQGQTRCKGETCFFSIHAGSVFSIVVEETLVYQCSTIVSPFVQPQDKKQEPQEDLSNFGDNVVSLFQTKH